MSVSIIAGPASDAVLAKLGSIEVFKPAPRSKAEEIVTRIRLIAEKGEVTHLIIQCDTERPLMAYAFLFADELVSYGCCNLPVFTSRHKDAHVRQPVPNGL